MTSRNPEWAERRRLDVVGRRIEQRALVLDADASRHRDAAAWLRAESGRAAESGVAYWAPADRSGALLCRFRPQAGLETEFWVRLAPGPDLRRIVAKGVVGFALPGEPAAFIAARASAPAPPEDC